MGNGLACCVDCGHVDPRNRSCGTLILCFGCANERFRFDILFREEAVKSVPEREQKYKIIGVKEGEHLKNSAIKYRIKQCGGCSAMSDTIPEDGSDCVICRYAKCIRERTNVPEFYYNLCFCGLGFASKSPIQRQCDYCNNHLLKNEKKKQKAEKKRQDAEKKRQDAEKKHEDMLYDI